MPHLIHEQQMAGPKSPEGFKPPSYHTNGGSNVAGPAGNGSGVGEEGGGNVHNHFYQVQSEDREPPRKSYPPKHMCIYICLLVATIIILMAIAVGVALAIILTNRSNNDEPSSPANPSPDDNNLPSVSILTKTTVVEVEVTSPSEPSLVTATMTVTYEPGTSVVTETQIQTYTAEPPPRIETSDANDDDVEDMLSSLLEQRPLISTQYVTISPSEEHTSPTTSSTTTSSTTSSMTSSTSTTATTATASTATSSASAALSTLSRISALDISSGSRRYIFWQDTDKHLVTSQFGGRRNETYRIVDKITDVGGEKPAQPKHGTPLAAADDETGALHVFYLGAKDNAIHQLTRLADGDWMATQVLHRGDALRAAPNSALSATWHRSDQFDGTRSRLVALAWQDDHLRVKTVMTEDPTDPDGWSISDLNTRMGVDVGRGARDDRGIAVSSGNLDGETLDRRASLFVAVEGDDAVMLWNCSVGANGFPLHIERCDWLNDTWSSKYMHNLRSVLLVFLWEK